MDLVKSRKEAVNNRVLVVDDEKAIAWALEESLTDAGYEAESVGSAEEALDLFKEKPFQVVLTDMKMPGMSGIELLGRVKEIKPETQVIIITAYGSFDSAVEAVRLGAFDYLQKPFNVENVKRMVAKAIRADEESAEEIVEENQDTKLKPLNIQEHILPSGESLLGSLSIDVKTVPKEGLGADFYDYFKIGENKILVTVGDVGEKGVNGSLVMIMVKSLIRSEASHCDDPSEILTRVNKHLHDQGITGIPITIFLGIMDTKESIFRFVNAGHEKPLFFSDVNILRTDVVSENSPFIGLFENPQFQPVTVKCEQGDLILLFTDGVIRLVESKFGKKDPYGFLKDSAAKLLPDKKYSLAEVLYREIVSGDQVPQDDVTIMSLFLGEAVCRKKEIRCVCENKSLILVKSATEDVLRALSLSYSKRHTIITSLYEALINAVNFAYPENSGGEMVIRYKIDKKRIRIEVEDFGVGFNWEDYQPPDKSSYEGLVKESGRGVFLMKNLMKKLDIKTELGKGTKVIMETDL